MATINVRIPTIMRPHTGGEAKVQLSGETVGDIISQLAVKFPGIAGQIVTDDGQLHRFVNVYVNDDDVRYIGKLDAPVNEGDEISILPAVAGGAI
jgi:sulfur-carrier protein